MPLRLGDELPSLAGATEWINSEGQPDGTSKGPLLVHFWSVSCYLCKNNFPKLRIWQDTYGPRGLKVVAVHMPRQEEDTNPQRVSEAIKEFSLAEPCAVDNQHAIKESFKNDQGWVPAYFLFDADGKLRSRSAGENGMAILGTALERMFDSQAASQAVA